MKKPVPYLINVGGELLDLSTPKVMGIVNLSPESFYTPSSVPSTPLQLHFNSPSTPLSADIVDIGACSTRPGHEEISPAEEERRLRNWFQGQQPIANSQQPTVNSQQPIISVDTARARIARMCVEEYGVHIVNDVSGGADPEMFRTVAELGVPYVLTHTGGWTGDSMQFKAMADKVQQLRDLGQNDIIIDPGFGFGKTVEENYALLRHLEEWQIFELPILVGVSRKSMIQHILGCTADEALNGTTVLNTIALMKGANILRVHDVKEAQEAIKLTAEIK